MALTWPVNAPVTQTFGSNPNNIQPNGHTGIDFGVAVGTALLAAGSGKVVFEGWASTLSANNIWWIAPAYAGICIVIDHGNGLLSLYGHLETTTVNIGQTVTQGQKIGTTGNTGLSTGPHLHFELLGWPLQPYNGYYGRVNPNNHVSGHWTGSVAPSNQPTRGNQRLAGKSNVNQRSQANPDAPITRVIAANTLEEFQGYVRGVSFEGNNIWYKDIHGYAWSGGFTNSSTTGLSDVTPQLRATQRLVGPDNNNQRLLPNTQSTVVRVIAANTTEEYNGFVYGEFVQGNNIWYKDSQGYTWSGGFTDSSTTGFADKTSELIAGLQPNQRFVISGGAIQRPAPARSDTVIRTIIGGTVETFDAYVKGESITSGGFTSDIWYKDSGGYVWSGGFVNTGTNGLSLFELPKPVPVPEPVPVPDPKPVPVVSTLKGIDISGHQAGINLNVIDTDFIVIKSSEGVGWTDPQFVNNLNKARATGKLVGFYHFARPFASTGNTAVAEAESFLTIVKPYLQVGDVLVLDWEAENQQNTVWAKEWLDIVAAQTDSTPLIYMNQSTANAHNWSDVKIKYKLWLAQYPSSVIQGYGPLIEKYGSVPGWSVAMWQYTSTGRLSGWSGNLDLNVFYGNAADWKVLGIQSKVPTVPDPVPVPEPIPVKDERAELLAYLVQAVDTWLANRNK